MRLLLPLLVLIFTAGVGSRRSGSGGHGTRGTSGGSRNPGSIKGTGSKPGSGSKPGYGWNVGGPTGGPKPGNKYVPPPGYSGSGSYKKGNVYNWNYNYPPVYVQASAPRIRNPLEYPGNYHGGAGSFRAGTGYVTVHNYNYYASKRHLPKNSAVKCSRKTKGIPPGEQNTTSPVETEMAWACPSDSVCCEWECCVKPQNENKKSQSSSDGSRWVLIFFLVLIIGVAGYYPEITAATARAHRKSTPNTTMMPNQPRLPSTLLHQSTIYHPSTRRLQTTAAPIRLRPRHIRAIRRPR